MPKIETPRAVKYAKTDVNYPFKDMIVSAISTLVSDVEKPTFPDELLDITERLIEHLDETARSLREGYIAVNEAAQDFDIQTHDGKPACLLCWTSIACVMYRSMCEALNMPTPEVIEALYMRTLTEKPLGFDLDPVDMARHKHENVDFRRVIGKLRDAEAIPSLTKIAQAKIWGETIVEKMTFRMEWAQAQIGALDPTHPNIYKFIEIMSDLQVQLEKDMQTMHHSESADFLRVSCIYNDKDTIARYFGL